MENCLFCNIISGEIPAEIVFENDNVLAFLDINPVNKGHVLVVPKVHSEDLLTSSGEILRNVISVVPKIAEAIMKSLEYEGFNLGVNNGKVAGQVIDHLHFHIMPRKDGDGHKLFVGKPYRDGEINEVGAKIKESLK